MAMVRTRNLFSWAAAVLLLAAAHGPAAGDEALREKALKLNDITGQDALRGKILELVKDKAELKKLVAEAAKMAKEKEQPFNYNGAYILAKVSHYTKEYDTSLVFYKICQTDATKLQSAQKLVDVYDGLINLFVETKKYDDAVKSCQEFLDLKVKSGGETIENAQLLFREKMIRALARQNKVEEALKLTDKLIELDEGGWYFLMLKADVLREVGKFDESISAFEDTIERLGKSKLEDELRDKFVERCQYMMTSVYTDLGKTDKAIEELRKLVKAHPDSSTYNNDLGYVLADHDKEFDEAERLIRKALELDKAERQKLKDQGLIESDDDKDNAAYLDSLGWVLFKKKNYVEAKRHLLEASKSDDGKHVEIFEHLGDVHKALGEKAEAVAVWQKALDLDNVTKRDDARKEAIKKKMADEAGASP
jgi:tetratricopeptide (TPR) repeat protein